MKKKRIDKILEIPQEVYTNMPKITITGFNDRKLQGNIRI